jgi:hypothetical protein
MTTRYIRLLYRYDGTWHNRIYATDDPEWRSAFISLSGSRYNVRIEYLHEPPAHDSSITSIHNNQTA